MQKEEGVSSSWNNWKSPLPRYFYCGPDPLVIFSERDALHPVGVTVGLSQNCHNALEERETTGWERVPERNHETNDIIPDDYWTIPPFYVMIAQLFWNLECFVIEYMIAVFIV